LRKGIGSFAGALLHFSFACMLKSFRIFLILIFILSSCKKDKPVQPTGGFQLTSISIGQNNLNLSSGASNTNMPVDQPIVAEFSDKLDVTTVSHSFLLLKGNDTIPLNYFFLDSNKTISAKPLDSLLTATSYQLVINSNLKTLEGKSFGGVTVSFTTIPTTVKIDSLSVGATNFLNTDRPTNVDRNFPCYIHFDHPLDASTINSNNIRVIHQGANASITIAVSNDAHSLTINANQPLIHFDKYTLSLSNQIKSTDGSVFNGYSEDFYTAIDTTPKFPILSDDDLLNLIQQQTFKYFYDFAYPGCGMARERSTSGSTVTTGGSGFGVMALIVGMERGFITRQEGTDRLSQILTFLESADRFHGAFPHWLDGNTGHIIHFNPNDGGDIVETSYMMMGLLTMRQYLNASDPTENDLITRINNLWNSVEWDWYTNNQNTLYWNWSSVLGFQLQLQGYNEALITYLLAAGSPTHTISADTYTNGWAGNGSIVNGNSYYGFTLPLGEAYGGPLFFEQYTYLGFNPNNLVDQYANYWTQCVNHTQINRAYCIDNPANWVGYSDQCWGLTASDNQNGYAAESPTNDLGVIAPTAAISSMPYTPQYSMDALKFFYYTIGDKTWGEYGFYDAFNVTAGWWDNQYIAIDEGPIIGMIENYRTGLLWNLFMSCPEVTTAMNKLGFSN